VTLTIVDRPGWGAVPPKIAPKPVNLSRLRAISHHYVGPKPSTSSSDFEFGQALQRWHQQNMGWSDIAYGFIVCRSGIVLAGRGVHAANFAEGGSTKADRPLLRGGGRHLKQTYGRDHARSWNPYCVSVVWQSGRTLDKAGYYADGEDEIPPQPQVDAARRLYDHINSQTPNDLVVDVHGSHRRKTCPGQWISWLAETGQLGPPPAGVRFIWPEEAAKITATLAKVGTLGGHQPASRVGPAASPSAVPASPAAPLTEYEQAVRMGITDGSNPEKACSRRHAAIMAFRAVSQIRSMQT